MNFIIQKEKEGGAIGKGIIKKMNDWDNFSFARETQMKEVISWRVEFEKLIVRVKLKSDETGGISWKRLNWEILARKLATANNN